MEPDSSYDDLTALFADEDTALAPPEAFVKSVMKPINKPSPWRQLFLFGAGGVGLGAAGSQLIGSFNSSIFNVFDLKLSAPSFDISMADMTSVSPTVLLIVGMVGCCLALMAFLERA